MSASTLLYPVAGYHPQPVIHHRLVPSSFCPSECNVTCSPACGGLHCCTTADPVSTVSYPAQSPTVSSPHLAQCAVPCGAICAPSCTPACCFTIYRPQMVKFWKRHHVHEHRHNWKVEATHKNMIRDTDLLTRSRNKNAWNFVLKRKLLRQNGSI